MKKLLFPFLLLTLAFGCNKKTAETDTTSANGNSNLATVLKNYYEDRLKLFPLEATAVADHRYNDQLPNDLTVAHRAKVKALYTQHLEQLKQLDTASLEAQEKLSYAIFKRDMEMALEGLTFLEHLMPVNQFWGLPLTMAQLGSGASNQPFKTAKDYDNFLGRITGFQAWGDTAIANMRRGMAAGYVLPKPLTQKVLPQLKALVTDVDAGLHSKGWTREQAIQFSKENEASDEQGIIAEIERYMAIPGQALSYKTGELKIRELRHRYQQQLGSKFRLNNFHDEILRDGVMPLAVLETKMNAWAAKQK